MRPASKLTPQPSPMKAPVAHEDHHPHDKTQFPEACGRCDFARKCDSSLLLSTLQIDSVIPPRRPEPRLVLLAETHHGVLVVLKPRLNHPVQVTEAPWCEPKSSDAKQPVKDLTVDFNPFLARRVVGVFVGVVHSRCRIQKKKEKHGAPGDDVETVYSH